MRAESSEYHSEPNYWFQMNTMGVGDAYGVSRSVWDGVLEQWKAEATLLFFRFEVHRVHQVCFDPSA